MRKTILSGMPTFLAVMVLAAAHVSGQTAASADSVLTVPSFGTSDLKLFMQLIFGLAIVLILLIFTLWILRYITRARFSGITGDAVRILSMQYIEPKKAIALVQVMDRVFILGIAEQAITTLGELTPEEAGAIRLDAEQNRQSFGSIFKRLWTRGPVSG